MTVGDAHHAARNFMAAIDKDPTSTQAADRLASLYRERNEQKPLIALLEKLAKLLAPMVATPGHDELRPRLVALHEELGRLWSDPPLARKDRAVENWRRVAELDPRNAFAVYQSRELLKEMQQFAEAIPYFAMEQATDIDDERRLALFRDESEVRLRAHDGPGASQALRQARGLRPDDIGLAQEFGASVVSRVDMGENVPQVEREEAKAIFVTLAESYDGEYGFGYAENALKCVPGDDRAMQLASHYAQTLGGKPRELAALYTAYLAANPSGYMAQEARQAVGSRQPSTPQAPAPLPPPQQAQQGQGRGSLPNVAMPPREPTGRGSQPFGFEGAGGGDFASPDTNEIRSLLDQASSEAQKGRKPTALAKYRDVLKLDPANAEALAWVDEHLRQKRMYADLRDVLLAASRVLSQSADTRKAQLRDVAGLCETQLRDVDTAIQAAKQIVQMDRGDDQAREQLRRLLEKAQRWDELATVLEQEATSAPDVETKINLEKKLAGLHEQKRKDPGAAAEAWARIAGLSPGDESAIQTAIKLFEKGEQWQDAANVIAENVSGLDDAALRSTLLAKLGELRLKSGSPGEAADAFAEAAEGRAQKAEGDAKQLAEAGKLWEQAEKAYVDASRFVEAANAVDQRGKLGGGSPTPALLVRAADLYEQAGDVPAAIEKLQEASRLEPESDDVATRLEAAFRAAERMSDLVDWLGERAQKLKDKARRSELRFKTAQVQREL
ncbi:MAG TPA: hypothetical protein VL400_11475, partial [Polyangiaceae bacterium]|nr:hypothetical protein [Polyangiaceae bacterium]